MYDKDIKKKGSGQMSRNEMEIRIEGLEKYYGKKHALKNVTLTIPSGMFGLLGRNGAGKTTLMKVLATLIGKQGGKVTVCGIPVEEAARIRRITGYLPQEFSMYPNMGVYEAMDYLGALSKMPKKVRKERIPVLLEKVNLQEHYRTKIRALSGGMKRRLGIAQAILHDPKVLIVDEPTAGLDPEERVRFRNLLCEIAEDRIVILSTHIVGDIEATCEQIAIMDEGEIYYNGTVMDLLRMTEGKVYTAQISRKDLAKMKENYVLTSMLTQGNNVMVRFLSEQKPQVEASACEPGVEDAYMYLMQEKEGFSHVLDLV
ncbi:ABC transporter ATP-binding protein [Sellimonas catena]|uniref:ABC transporter ATP-binding protein n=2 Tax=Sellimonas catena TaxID=2994035 RepID=A0A9W6CA64_9FIRM|nr:ABC transporter ATP-binding protein [Sellimonas catena]